MFESEGGGMRNSASQMNSAGLLSGADGLNELLLILGDHYIPTVQAEEFFFDQPKEPEDKKEPWLREVGVKLLLRIMDRVFTEMSTERGELGSALVMNQEKYLQEKDLLETQITNLSEKNEELMNQIRREGGEKQLSEAGVYKGSTTDEGMLSATNLLDVVNQSDSDSKSSTDSFRRSKLASSRLSSQPKRKRKPGEEGLNIFKKRGKVELRPAAAHKDDVSFVPETMALVNNSEHSNPSGEYTIIPDTPEKKENSGTSSSGKNFVKDLNSDFNPSKPNPHLNLNAARGPSPAEEEEDDEERSKSPIFFRTRHVIPGLAPPADGQLNRVKILDRRQNRENSSQKEKSKNIGNSAKLCESSTKNNPVITAESAYKNTSDGVSNTDRQSESRVISDKRLGRAVIDFGSTCKVKTPGIISPTKQMIADQKNWSQINEDFGPSTRIESDSDFESPNLLKIVPRRSRVEPRVDHLRAEPMGELEDDISTFCSPPEQPSKLLRTSKMSKEATKSSLSKTSFDKAKQEKEIIQKTKTISVTPKKKEPIQKTKTISVTPKKKVMKGPKKTLNRYGMEVEEVTSSTKKRMKNMKQSKVDMYFKNPPDDVKRKKNDFDIAMRNSVETFAEEQERLQKEKQQQERVQRQLQQPERVQKQRQQQQEQELVQKQLQQQQQQELVQKQLQQQQQQELVQKQLQQQQQQELVQKQLQQQKQQELVQKQQQQHSRQKGTEKDKENTRGRSITENIPMANKAASSSSRPSKTSKPSSIQNDSLAFSQEETVPYAYVGPSVRKREDRAKLKGFDCHECEEYYRGKIEEGFTEEQVAKLMNDCSKHRARYKPPLTPEKFWDPEIIVGDPDSPRNKTQNLPPLRTRALRRKESRERREKREKGQLNLDPKTRGEGENEGRGQRDGRGEGGRRQEAKNIFDDHEDYNID